YPLGYTAASSMLARRPAVPSAPRGAWSVAWEGAQRDVLGGNVSGLVDLERFAATPHVSALGPLEGVSGEITIVDGEPSVARVRNGAVVTERTFRARGCFLVWAVVPRWRSVELARPVEDLAGLERVVIERARADGLDVDQPFPFRL